MNKEEFKIEIGKIQIAYNKIFTQEEKRLWFQEFQNTTKEEFEEAIKKTIKTNKFVPKIADIKEKINENTYKYYLDDPYNYLYKNNEWGKNKESDCIDN